MFVQILCSDCNYNHIVMAQALSCNDIFISVFFGSAVLFQRIEVFELHVYCCSQFTGSFPADGLYVCVWLVFSVGCCAGMFWSWLNVGGMAHVFGHSLVLDVSLCVGKSLLGCIYFLPARHFCSAHCQVNS